MLIHLLLVTTPSRWMMLGWSNWPMMLASARKSRLCFSVYPAFSVLIATMSSLFPGSLSGPLHTSPNSPDKQHTVRHQDRQGQIKIPYRGINMHLHFERECARYTASRYQRQAVLVFACLLYTTELRAEYFYCKCLAWALYQVYVYLWLYGTINQKQHSVYCIQKWCEV